MQTPQINKRKISSTAVFSIGFLALILLGTILLTLPFSSADGTFTNPLDAAFTAVSATCVTGLITVARMARFTRSKRKVKAPFSITPVKETRCKTSSGISFPLLLR